MRTFAIIFGSVSVKLGPAELNVTDFLVVRYNDYVHSLNILLELLENFSRRVSCPLPNTSSMGC